MADLEDSYYTPKDLGDLYCTPHDQQQWQASDYYFNRSIVDCLRNGFADGLGFLASIFALQALSYELEFVLFPVPDLWKRLGIVSLSIGIGFLWRRMWVNRIYGLQNGHWLMAYHHVANPDPRDVIDD